MTNEDKITAILEKVAEGMVEQAEISKDLWKRVSDLEENLLECFERLNKLEKKIDDASVYSWD